MIRIKMPENETVQFTDLIRGSISNETQLVDDKVLLKSDGMPTYHLAVVVDDYLMKITHAFRGEEWLPSAPIHILLWQYLGWENEMPQWAHLPLILKPDGNGKLSKRDGERLGFPVFAMEWKDPKTGDIVEGFKEKGFLPEAFINILAMLGWNAGTEQEIFSLEELCDLFSLERVHKGGAKFDYEKAKWYNQQHIQRADNARLAQLSKPYFTAKGITVADDKQLEQAVAMVKERCHLLSDFAEQASFLFAAPVTHDLDAVKPKWAAEKAAFFTKWMDSLTQLDEPAAMETAFGTLAAEEGLKKGELMMPLRIMLVGGKFGPGVFDIIHFIGLEDTKARVQHMLTALA
ncbi:Glutamate--tRNA ligase [compost metagenome]